MNEQTSKQIEEMSLSGPFLLLWLQYRYNGKTVQCSFISRRAMQQYRLVLVPGPWSLDNLEEHSHLSSPQTPTSHLFLQETNTHMSSSPNTWRSVCYSNLDRTLTGATGCRNDHLLPKRGNSELAPLCGRQ